MAVPMLYCCLWLACMPLLLLLLQQQLQQLHSFPLN